MTAFLIIDFCWEGCDDQQLEVTVCPFFIPAFKSSESVRAPDESENHESINVIYSSQNTGELLEWKTIFFEREREKQ